MYTYIVAGIFLPYVIIYSIPMYLLYKHFWEEKIIESLIPFIVNTKQFSDVVFRI
jgi:hypothetical protein